MRAWVAVLRWIIVKRLARRVVRTAFAYGAVLSRGLHVLRGKNVRARGVCRQRQPVAERACDGFINKL